MVQGMGTSARRSGSELLLLLLLLVGGCLAVAGGCGDPGSSVPGEGEGEEGEGEGEGGGGEGEGSAGPCTSRRDCPGQICDLSATPPACVDPPLECEGDNQCPPGSVCELDTCNEGCSNSEDCANGWVCRRISATANRCFQDCRSLPCPDGSSCVENICLPDVVLCRACQEDDDCGGPLDRCLEVGESGKFCAKDCNLTRECPAGYRCRSIGADAWQCIPAVGDCTTNCQITGCDDIDFPFCNPSSGHCQEQLAPCDPCATNDACGPEARCVGLDGVRHCLPTCERQAPTCPAGFSCETSLAQPLCLPLSGTCDRCANQLCGPLSPYCNPATGTCTECLATLDCASGLVCAESSRLCLAKGPTCTVGGEPCAAPYAHCFEGRCVECISTADCPEDGLICHNFRCYGEDFCQRVTCPVGTTVCDTEARACVEIGICADDEDCGGTRRCDVPNGVCYNADATCVTDAECPITLSCDRQRRLCKGCESNADCRVPFQQCVNLGSGRYCQQI